MSNTYFCKKCNKPFLKACAVVLHERYCGQLKNEKRSTIRRKQVSSILEVTTRLASKQLNKFKIGCSICGWDEARCDSHHIISRENGGKDTLDNLIIVCPNCHRLIHIKKKYSIEFLKTKNVTTLLDKIVGLKEFLATKQEQQKQKYEQLRLPNVISKEIQLKITLVKNSDIDFSNFGWVGKVSKIIEVKPQKVGRWMNKYMHEFYHNLCFKRKSGYQLDKFQNT
ncbi:MAG: HNH endonuclease signature motif containing protein [Lutibacter sp.]|jgi:hypothetical protein